MWYNIKKQQGIIMKTVSKPSVYLIGESKINEDELSRYLNDINVNEWNTDANSDIEKLSEFYGRLCYMSFEPGLNPNVTKIRKGNENYLNNIIDSGHGSVFEHGFLNFIFRNVSRILCMELIRHRVGVGISQESLRYVRLEDLTVYVPTCMTNDYEKYKFYCEKIEEFEEIQKQLADMFKINECKDFTTKKELTSAFRRLAPEGLTTTIGWSCNYRTLRHVITTRTSPHAEEEIRKLFIEVYNCVKYRHPNMLQNCEVIDTEDGLVWIKLGKI